MIKLTSCLVPLVVLSIQSAFSQSSTRETVNQSIQWFAVSSNIKMTKNLSLFLEGQFRQADDFDPQQYQIRTALDIRLSDHFSAAPLGYVYTWNYKYGKQPAAFANNEHRIWQQLFYKHSIRAIKVDHRLRLEQRFIQHHSVMDDGTIINEGYVVKQYRIRYRLMAKQPINSPKIEAGSYFISVYDEVFVSWGDYVTYHEPDQNRLFAGLGYQFDKNLMLQGGFLYQLLIKANNAKQENNIGFQVQLTYNLDCSKSNP